MEPEIELHIEYFSDSDLAKNRRQAEIETVGRMIRKVFGNEAALEHDSEGRPSICCPRFNGSISISHSLESCVLAVTHCPTASIGIDVETWREQLYRVARRFLSEEELPVYNTRELLLLAWTTKEAVYKAARIPGLPLKEIHLPLQIPDSNRFSAVACDKTFIVTSCTLSPDKAITAAFIAPT